jgi:signal transduction histidine kinase
MTAKPRRSLIFRYALVYIGLFGLSVSGVLGALYWSTLRLYDQQQEAAIAAEMHGLRGQLVGRSVTEMAAVITRRSDAEPGRTSIYMLATRSYEYVAGNLHAWPEDLDEGEHKIVEIEPADPASGAPTGDVTGDAAGGEARTTVPRARVHVDTLPTGHRLLVGRNLEEVERFRSLIGEALLGTILLTIVLGAGGGYVMSRRLLGRLDTINRSSAAILGGDIAQRMPVRGTGDEYDVLAGNLNRMLDQIAALMAGIRNVTDDIAHDMRTPIARLRSRIEVTLMTPTDADGYRQALERTIEETDEILGMFNALLTSATAESGTPRERFTAVNLVDIARSTVELYGPLAEEAGYTLTLDASDPVRVQGERHLVTQALSNLVDNAITHGPQAGRITVSVVADGADAVLSVADEGSGIPAACREKALERFGRLDTSRSRPGSGLGLSLVRAVARLHGGEVVLEDNRPGLRVTLRFPGRTTSAG